MPIIPSTEEETTGQKIKIILNCKGTLGLFKTQETLSRKLHEIKRIHLYWKYQLPHKVNLASKRDCYTSHITPGEVTEHLRLSIQTIPRDAYTVRPCLNRRKLLCCCDNNNKIKCPINNSTDPPLSVTMSLQFFMTT